MRNPTVGKLNSPRGTRACHKCGRKGHYAKEYHGSSYVIAMYKELQSLREGKRETHTLDAPSPTLSELNP